MYVVSLHTESTDSVIKLGENWEKLYCQVMWTRWITPLLPQETISDELKGPLYNSISEGMLPDKWKEATIAALHKKGKKDLPSNYRPVSLTSIICKITLEKKSSII